MLPLRVTLGEPGLRVTVMVLLPMVVMSAPDDWLF
jgi:hypothetical protein